MEWEAFKKQFLQRFPVGERSKTYASLMKIVPVLPESATPEDLYIFAPGAIWGSAFEIPHHQYVIYLAPTLESDDQIGIDFTVAHEFAHVSRRVEGIGLPVGDEDEKATDALAASWGFKEPPMNWDWYQFGNRF